MTRRAQARSSPEMGQAGGAPPALAPTNRYNQPPPSLPGEAGGYRLRTRSAATGQHAEWLDEATGRIDAVAGLLAAVALDHVDADDLAECLPALVKTLDAASRFARRAGER